MIEKLTPLSNQITTSVRIIEQIHLVSESLGVNQTFEIINGDFKLLELKVFSLMENTSFFDESASLEIYCH